MSIIGMLFSYNGLFKVVILTECMYALITVAFNSLFQAEYPLRVCWFANALSLNGITALLYQCHVFNYRRRSLFQFIYIYSAGQTAGIKYDFMLPG